MPEKTFLGWQIWNPFIINTYIPCLSVFCLEVNSWSCAYTYFHSLSGNHMLWAIPGFLYQYYHYVMKWVEPQGYNIVITTWVREFDLCAEIMVLSYTTFWSSFLYYIVEWSKCLTPPKCQFWLLPNPTWKSGNSTVKNIIILSVTLQSWHNFFLPLQLHITWHANDSS